MRILNIHPSLLPSFPGVDAQRQAFEHGVKVSGVTVHLVTADLDGGPIVVQRAVPVLGRRHRRIRLRREFSRRNIVRIPRRCSMILDGGWRIDGRRWSRLKLRTSAAASRSRLPADS